MNGLKKVMNKKNVLCMVGVLVLVSALVLICALSSYTMAKYITSNKVDTSASVASLIYSFGVEEISSQQFINADYWLELEMPNLLVRDKGAKLGEKNRDTVNEDVALTSFSAPNQPYSPPNMQMMGNIDNSWTVSSNNYAPTGSNKKYGDFFYRNGTETFDIVWEDSVDSNVRVGTTLGSVTAHPNDPVADGTVGTNTQYKYSGYFEGTVSYQYKARGTDGLYANALPSAITFSIKINYEYHATNNSRTMTLVSNSLRLTVDADHDYGRTTVSAGSVRVEGREDHVTSALRYVQGEPATIEQDWQNYTITRKVDDTYYIGDISGQSNKVVINVERSRAFHDNIGSKTTTSWTEVYSVVETTVSQEPIESAMNSPRIISFTLGNSRENAEGGKDVCEVSMKSKFSVLIPEELLLSGAIQMIEKLVNGSDELTPLSPQILFEDVIAAIKAGETTVDSSTFKDYGELGNMNCILHLSNAVLAGDRLQSLVIETDPDNPENNLVYNISKVTRSETYSIAYPRGEIRETLAGPSNDLSASTIYMNMAGDVSYYQIDITAPSMYFAAGEDTLHEYLFEFVPTKRVIDTSTGDDVESVYMQDDCKGWHYDMNIQNAAKELLSLRVQYVKAENNGAGAYHLFNVVNGVEYEINQTNWTCQIEGTTVDLSSFNLAPFTQDSGSGESFKHSWQYNPLKSDYSLGVDSTIGKTFMVFILATFEQVQNI